MTRNDNCPFVSVVICSRDRHQLLEKAVESVHAVDYPQEKYEIIVMEEGDEPSPIPEVVYKFLPRRNLGLGYARKQGVKAAKGKFIIFTDDDCAPEKNWLAQIIQPMLDDPQAYGVSGATLVKGNPALGTCESILGFPGGGYRRYVQAKGKIVETPSASGCNMAYRAEVFHHLEIDDLRYGKLGADDAALSRKVAKKWKLVFNPHAIVFHKPRNSWIGIFRLFQRRRYLELVLTKGFWGRTREIVSIRRGMIPRTLLAILVLVFTGEIGLYVVLGGLFILYGFLPVRYARELKAANARWSSYLLLIFVKAIADFSLLATDIKLALSLPFIHDVKSDKKTLDKYYGR